MNDILVSVRCNTYNHEDYIADAIEGFLIQKTNMILLKKKSLKLY